MHSFTTSSLTHPSTMASTTSKPLQCLALFLLLAQLAHSAFIPKPKNRTEHKPDQLSNTYIVHANHLLKPSRFATLEHWYISMVATHSPRAATNATAAAAAVAGRILYTYDTVMHGFAVRLAADEARSLSRGAPGVTAVHQARMYYPQTTRSPGFIGLDPEYGLWRDTEFGDGVIIGVIDSGIWPESPSFNDSGLAAVRRSWKGGCVGLGARLCNNKVVGAKDFSAAEYGGASSPRDDVGHGTHVASTAAGSEVHGAGLFMFARGTARGVAPKARIAMYKCGGNWGCSDASIIAGIDAAVKDGVDIISISLGGFPIPFYEDSLAIATFGAQREGVFVALAGGNSGPRPYTVTNVAPWMTTVGAGAVDRLFPANLTLGNGEVLVGQSLYTKMATGTTMAPLVLLDSCDEWSLSPDVVMGKIVVCLAGVYEGMLLQNAGGAGLVSMQGEEWHGDGVVADAFTLPALTLSYSKAEKLMDYFESAASPVASFSFACETVTGENRAPTAVGFSSRGPNRVVPELLKPDVLAPGLNILAAWPRDIPVSMLNMDTRRSEFNILSGTSMACPHAAGVAALIKKRHGDWTPAMIRSAMMTTAATLDNTGRDITDEGVQEAANATFTSATPLAAGAGHVRPQLAVDPGLVYDAGVEDYVDFLCSLNYTVEQLRVFVPDTAGCAPALPGGGPANLNYPSFVVAFNGSTRVRTLTRTVTKVYEKPETYSVAVSAPAGVKVTVRPATLEFKEKNEEKSYTVEFTSVAGGHVNQSWDFGHISWENRKHQVRSPVVFMWN